MTDTREALGTAGNFRVFEDGTIEGPAEYLAVYDQAGILRTAKIFGAAAPHVTIYQILAVALQTDYAAWLGLQGLGGEEHLTCSLHRRQRMKGYRAEGK